MGLQISVDEQGLQTIPPYVYITLAVLTVGLVSTPASRHPGELRVLFPGRIVLVTCDFNVYNHIIPCILKFDLPKP